MRLSRRDALAALAGVTAAGGGVAVGALGTRDAPVAGRAAGTDEDEGRTDDEALSSSVEGYGDAYEVWMNAAEEMSGRTTAAAEGEDVDMTEFRDIWLQSANEAFKEVMGTSAFAAANGQLVNAMMEMREEVDSMGEDTLEQLGMPTQSDIDEVGERIIELERRQHSVEKKLDRIIEALE